MLLLKDQHQESEWWSFTQHITLRMERDIKEICLRRTPTHAQRINQCPISILYTGFYNPLQSIKQQTQQRTVKNGNRKRDFITLCIAHFGGGNTPPARVLQSALNHQGFDSAKWPMAALGWQMCSALGVLPSLPQPHSSPGTARICAVVLSCSCVCSRDFKRGRMEVRRDSKREKVQAGLEPDLQSDGKAASFLPLCLYLLRL